MGLKVTAESSLRRASFVKTMSRGMPGLTSAALMYSVPKSMPMTAFAASAVEANIQNRHNIVERFEKAMPEERREANAMIIGGGVGELVGE